MDLEGAPLPNKNIFIHIKDILKHSVSQEEMSLSLQAVQDIIDHYKRVMNEMVFRKEVKMSNLDIYLPNKYLNKKITSNHIRK